MISFWRYHPRRLHPPRRVHREGGTCGHRGNYNAIYAGGKSEIVVPARQNLRVWKLSCLPSQVWLGVDKQRKTITIMAEQAKRPPFFDHKVGQVAQGTPKP